MSHKLKELATMGLGKCFKVTLQTRAPKNFRSRQWGAERRVERAQTRKREPPSAPFCPYICMKHTPLHILCNACITPCHNNTRDSAPAILVKLITKMQGVTFPAGLRVLPAGNLGISHEIQPMCLVIPSKIVSQ